MTDQLRALAEAEAAKRWGAPDPAIIHPSQMDRMDSNMRREYVEGFIAGRTSVTQEQIAEVLYYSSFDRGQTCVLWPDATGWMREAAYRQARAVRELFGEAAGDE